MELWLTSDIFHWVTSVETANVARGREWFRAYEIWEHADQILGQTCNEFHLTDTITKWGQTLIIEYLTLC